MDKWLRTRPEISKCHQIREVYILIGFTSTCSDPPLALCFCGEKLANLEAQAHDSQ